MESMNSFVERHDWRRNIFQVQKSPGQRRK